MSASTRRPLRGCFCCNDPLPSAGHVSRRNFLAGGVAALGLGTTQARPALAQAPAPARSRIDVHHHYLAPVQREALLKSRPGGLP